MPPKRTTPEGYEHGRELRKNPTPAERKLWARLRNREINGVKFRRQHAIGNKDLTGFLVARVHHGLRVDNDASLEWCRGNLSGLETDRRGSDLRCIHVWLTVLLKLFK